MRRAVTNRIEASLFSSEPLESSKRKNERPLGRLSDFVVNDLPGYLATEKFNQLFPKIEKKLLANPDSVIKLLGRLNKQTLLLARLDLLILEAALRQKNYVSKNLNIILEFLEEKTNRPGIITYEDIVLNNPPRDIRTFTNGRVGRQEADFYIGHQMVEERLGLIISILLLATKKMRGKSFDERIIQATGFFDEVIQLTAAIGLNMDSEAFKKFRVYLGSKVASDGTVVAKGPSGAFSAKVPIIDCLVKDKLSEEHTTYVLENEQYFPKTEIFMLLSLMEKESEPLHSIATKRNANPELVFELEKRIKTFRGMHLRGVKHQIPEIFDGLAAGTGGEMNVRGFLTRRIND